MILTEFDEKLYKKTLLEEGIERGTERTIRLANTVFKLSRAGKNYEEIAKAMGISIKQIRELLD